MRAIIALAGKDIRLLLRDKFGLFWLLAFPLMMALFFGAIFSSGSSSRASMKIAAVDSAQNEQSQAFIGKLDSSAAITVIPTTLDSARQMVRTGKAVAFIELLDGFGELSRVFAGDTSATMKIGIDPARQAEAGYLQGLIMEAWFAQLQSVFASPSNGRQFIDDFIRQMGGDSISAEERIVKQFLGQLDGFLAEIDTGSLASDTTSGESSQQSMMAGPRIVTESIVKEQSGPRSSWEITFPQALLWALIGCTAAFAITIVTERTKGTLIRLRQAPISRAQILAGKGLACFISAVAVCTILLAIAILIFGVRTPNPTALVLAIVCSAICFVGLMMLISVMGKTEQAVGGAGWAILLVFSMTGGGMVPLMVMPDWMLTMSNFSPVKWGIYAFEGAIWRGFSMTEMTLPLGILVGIGLAAFSVGVLIFRKSN